MSLEWEIEELAGYALGKTESEVEAMINDETVDDELGARYGVDLEIYCEIIKDLLPFTPCVQAGISKNFYHAFVVEDQRRMVVKQKKAFEGS